MIAEQLTLADAAKKCPGRPSANAVWRWCRKGVKSRGGRIIRLQHIRVGGRIYTTAEALEKFFSGLADADSAYFDRSSNASNHLEAVSPQANIDRRLAQANQLLDQAGF